MEVVVERIVAGGLGIGRTRDGVVLVAGGLPGERVRLGQVLRRGGAAVARAEEILEPHAARVASDCPFFPACGGCDLRHAAYELELEMKRGIVADAIRRIGKIEASVAPVKPSPRVAGYRNHVKFRAAAGRLGFCVAGSAEVVDVETCLLARPEIAEVYAAIRRRGTRAEVVTIRTDGESTHAVESVRGRSAPDPPPLAMPLAGRRFRTSWRSFFQVNLDVAEVLVERVRDLAGGGGLLLDAYAGVGVFAAALADRFDRVVALEISSPAVDDARTNLADLAAVVRRWDAGRGLPLGEIGGTPDVAIVDPPREGLAPATVRDLLRLRPRRIVYVSCDPATLARDIGRLAAGYRLAGTVEPIDMFPRTAHVECLACLDAAV